MKPEIRAQGYVQGARENLGELSRAFRGAIPAEYAIDAALGLERQALALREIVQQMSHIQAGVRSADVQQQQPKEIVRP